MTKATATVAAMVTILTAGSALRIDAASNPELVVVVHVTDYAHISSRELAAAERVAARVYAAAGVRAIWTDGAERTPQPDRAFHIDVSLLSRDMVVQKCQTEGIEEGVFGRAASATKRAYIFYNRIVDRSVHTRVDVSRLLGMVLAHEIGHVLLPADSHSASGIMRGTWEGRIVNVPNFTDDQGAAIRSLLAAVHAN